MPKTKKIIKNAIRIAVATDPLSEFLNNNLRAAAKWDSLEQIHVTNPVYNAKTGTLGQAAKTDSLEQAAKPVTLGKAAKPGTLGQAIKTDDLDQAAKPGTLGQAIKTDDLEQAAQTDALGQALKSDTLGRAAKSDSFGPVVKNDNLQNSLMTDSLREAVSFDCSEKAATANMFRQIAIASYSGQIETEKVLDMNKNIDYKENYTYDVDNLTPFRQNATDNVALKTKCEDLVEQVNKSLIKPRKYKSKKSSSKRYQTTENKLTNFIDVQQLLNIGYRNPELLPLIKRVSVINDLFANFSFQVQSELVSIIRIVAKTIKEFDYMKQNASNSYEIQDVVYKLIPNLNKSFCGVVLKRGSFIFDPTVRNLVEWNTVLKKLPKNTNQSSSGLFDLSSRFRTKDLIVIGKDHPEFRKNIRTILGLSSAMKHLDHGDQVEMYKILRKMENIIKNLVKHKTDKEGCQDIFLTPDVLTSSLDFCTEKILMLLKTSPSAPVECFQCDRDRSHATEGDVEPNFVNRLEVNQMMSVFDCANWGIEHDRINNLESLIHHLASKKNALEYFFSFQQCVDWFEIVRLHSKYRLETIPGMVKMYILRQIILRTVNKVEKILDIARSASNEMKRVVFVSNKTLSDVIALSGQIEMLTSGVERYLNAFVVHSGNVLRLLNEYGVVSLRVRDNRFQFLTKPQWKAFNFPFLI